MIGQLVNTQRNILVSFKAKVGMVDGHFSLMRVRSSMAVSCGLLREINIFDNRVRMEIVTYRKYFQTEEA